MRLSSFFTKTVLFFALVLSSSLAWGAATDTFDHFRSKASIDYVLKDALVFELFDMSDLKVVRDSKLKDTLEKKTKAEVRDIPGRFFKSLQQAVYRQNVPLETYSGSFPDFVQPLGMTIKLTEIRLSAGSKATHQKLRLKIKGVVTDLIKDKALFEWSDSATVELSLTTKNVVSGLEPATTGLMKDLAIYLRSFY